MRTILLTVLCAVAIGTQAKVANDTIDKYIIDKQPIEHFDGSQLEGKHISKYMIAYKQGRGVVERHHVIYTGTGELKIVGSGNATSAYSGEPLLIIDGKEASKEDYEKLNPQEIDHIDVLKAGSKAAEEMYGEKGIRGVIIVTTKSSRAVSNVSEPLLVIDGKEVSKEDYEKLNSQEIDHIDVLKAGSKAAKEMYGEKGRNGVIIITTKGGKGSK